MRSADIAPSFPVAVRRPVRQMSAPATTGAIHALRRAWRQRDRGMTNAVATAELGRETGVRC